MIRSAVLRGLDVVLVEVEVALNPGKDKFNISGLGKQEVKESKYRLENAVRAAGYEWPGGTIVVNLAPADVPKGGTQLDLAIALELLKSTRQIRSSLDGAVYAVGELSLEGTIRKAPGALTIAKQIPDGSVLIAPRQNNHELALLLMVKDGKKDYTPYVVDSLKNAANTLEAKTGTVAYARKEHFRSGLPSGRDFRDIQGQERAKRALEVAAAGGHNVLLIGPPGEGKSLLAKALPTILPKLSPAEAIELTAIYSAAGKLDSNSIVDRRPFEMVLPTTSRQALIGGGTGTPTPGLITLAHRGILFLDELPEYGRALLETLRQPLEDGYLSIQRVGGAARFPCEIILVAAMNPCPCARDGEYVCKACNRRLSSDQDRCECGANDRRTLCSCTEYQKQSYKARISGAIIDRIDLKIRVSALSADERFGSATGEDSKTIRERVQAARDIQVRRYQGTGILVNARIPGGSVRKYCELHPSAEVALREVAARIPELTTRGHDKLLKTARTVADLNNSAVVYKKHVIEAAELCGHESVRDFLRSLGEVSPCPMCNASIEPRHRFCPNCGASVRGKDGMSESRAAGVFVQEDYTEEIPRNAPCPCGSGKKYKNCCMPTSAKWSRTR
jgi:magnesium chelatase family protein